MWLNLVEHLLWEQRVAGSNPVIPIYEDRGVTVSITGCDPVGEGSSPFDPPKNLLTFFNICNILKKEYSYYEK